MTSARKALLAAVGIVVIVLRIGGWDRGVSDFVFPEASENGKTSSFFHFHPDETTLLQASLHLEDPTKPPLTAYGTLPMYVARVVLEAAAFASGRPAELETEEGRRFAVQTARVLSLVLSLVTLLVIWVLTRRLWGDDSGLGVLLMVGAAPLAIQQSQFYTVDGLFALLALMSLGATIQLAEKRSPFAYVIAGILIGATAATRLNGLLTAVVLVVIHISVLPGTGWRRQLRKLRAPELWYAGFATILTLLVLQPHLLLNPGAMFQSTSTNDFAYSMAIARGEVLRTWSLFDTHTIPYLHFWTDLWPQGVGWPLTLLLAAGWIRALVRGGQADRWIALWCLLFFLTVGGLHTKHVRYLLPLLAPLAMLAAHLISSLWDRYRNRWVIGISVCILLHTWTYGIAFSRIYRVEDARISAGRWIHENVPKGASVAVERGGFSMRGSFSDKTYVEHDLNTSTIFATRGYLTCGAAAQYLESRLDDVDWIAITDVNRYRQYAAAADLYPVLASFYQVLVEGGLGFHPEQYFKVYPKVAGLSFPDDDAEPSFLGFDHPAVHVFRQEPEYRKALEDWRGVAGYLPGCADSDLIEAARSMEAGDLDQSETSLALASVKAPGLAHLLQAMVHERRGARGLAHASFRAFSSGAYDRSLAASLLPWAAASSLVGLDLVSEGVRVLELGWERRTSLATVDREIMARSYMYVGARLREAGWNELEERAYLMAADLWDAPQTLNAAAQSVYDRGNMVMARALWGRSLVLNDVQIGTHVAAGRAAANSGDGAAALSHFRKVVEISLAGAGPRSVETVAHTARWLHELGQATEATDYLGKVATRRPEWAPQLKLDTQ
jgi:hypothetical protein